jgi:hypothetical protein
MRPHRRRSSARPSDDFEIWCGNWTPHRHRRAAELMLEFHYPAREKPSVDVHWKTWRDE